MFYVYNINIIFQNIFFRWTVLSSIHETNEKSNELYVKLHLALLESLLDSTLSSTKRPEHIISAQHLATIVPQIVASVFMDTDERLSNAIDRLGQAIQIALHTKSVYGNKRKWLLFLVYF